MTRIAVAAVRLTSLVCAIAGFLILAVWTARSFWFMDEVRWEVTAVHGALVTTCAIEARVVHGSMELVWRSYEHQIDYTQDDCGPRWVATLTSDDGLSLRSVPVGVQSQRGEFYESAANWRLAGIGWYREGRLCESIRVLEAPSLAFVLACGLPAVWGVVCMAARRRRAG